MKTVQAGDFTQVASGIYLEGLGVDYTSGAIWFSDVIAGGVHGVMPDGRVIASFDADRQWTGGIMMNDDGSVLSSGPGGIRWNHPDTGRSGWLLDELEGKPINGINEMIPDGTGGIFFGTNDIEMVIAGRTARPSAVYRLTVDREVTRLADGFSCSNGIMFDASAESSTATTRSPVPMPSMCAPT
jgi:sugar lactone lactonase YvrE